MEITAREQLAPAIRKIRQDVYAAAKECRWSVSELQEQTEQAIRRFANQLESQGRFEWAEVVRKLYLGEVQ